MKITDLYDQNIDCFRAQILLSHFQHENVNKMEKDKNSVLLLKFVDKTNNNHNVRSHTVLLKTADTSINSQYITSWKQGYNLEWESRHIQTAQWESIALRGIPYELGFSHTVNYKESNDLKAEVYWIHDQYNLSFAQGQCDFSSHVKPYSCSKFQLHSRNKVYIFLKAPDICDEHESKKIKKYNQKNILHGIRL